MLWKWNSWSLGNASGKSHVMEFKIDCYGLGHLTTSVVESLYIFSCTIYLPICLKCHNISAYVHNMSAYNDFIAILLRCKRRISNYISIKDVQCNSTCSIYLHQSFLIISLIYWHSTNCTLFTESIAMMYFCYIFFYAIEISYYIGRKMFT